MLLESVHKARHLVEYLKPDKVRLRPSAASAAVVPAALHVHSQFIMHADSLRTDV